MKLPRIGMCVHKRMHPYLMEPQWQLHISTIICVYNGLLAEKYGTCNSRKLLILFRLGDDLHCQADWLHLYIFLNIRKSCDLFMSI